MYVSSYHLKLEICVNIASAECAKCSLCVHCLNYLNTSVNLKYISTFAFLYQYVYFKSIFDVDYTVLILWK